MITVPASEQMRLIVVGAPEYFARHPAPANLRLALAGVGLALAREDIVGHHIERGKLVSVLKEFSTPFPRFYFYYPARR